MTPGGPEHLLTAPDPSDFLLRIEQLRCAAKIRQHEVAALQSQFSGLQQSCCENERLLAAVKSKMAKERSVVSQLHGTLAELGGKQRELSMHAQALEQFTHEVLEEVAVMRLAKEKPAKGASRPCCAHCGKRTCAFLMVCQLRRRQIETIVSFKDLDDLLRREFNERSAVLWGAVADHFRPPQSN